MQVEIYESDTKESDLDDSRQWTQEHMVAANIPNPSIMALTPPQGDDQYDSGCRNDVDVKGPGLCTFLIAINILYSVCIGKW